MGGGPSDSPCAPLSLPAPRALRAGWPQPPSARRNESGQGRSRPPAPDSGEPPPWTPCGVRPAALAASSLPAHDARRTPRLGCALLEAGGRRGCRAAGVPAPPPTPGLSPPRLLTVPATPTSSRLVQPRAGGGNCRGNQNAQQLEGGGSAPSPAAGQWRQSTLQPVPGAPLPAKVDQNVANRPYVPYIAPPPPALLLRLAAWGRTCVRVFSIK